MIHRFSTGTYVSVAIGNMIHPAVVSKDDFGEFVVTFVTIALNVSTHV